MGPGKAELLEYLSETASLSEAARRMNMSYMRAWSLVRTMNASFKEPLVKAERGGRHGGGAQLTDLGREVLSLYREMETASLLAIRDTWRKMSRLLRAAE